MESSDGGCLSPERLNTYLGSFATVLCACTEEGMEMPPEVLRSVIAAASASAVTSLMGEDTLGENPFCCDCCSWFG